MFDNLSQRLTQSLHTLQGRHKLSEKNIQSALADVRRALLEADAALSVVKAFISAIEQKAIGIQVASGLTPTQAFIKLVQQELIAILGSEHQALNLKTQPPAIIMVAGLQGAGKTTTVAKLAYYLTKQLHKKVLVTSCDIYRPGAIEQLNVLCQQIAVDYANDDTQNAMDVAKNAVKLANAQFYDVLLVDTAGRLHIDETMMAEIAQLQQVLLPIETLFVVDSMTGRMPRIPLKHSRIALSLSGTIITKTDGDARGGAALSLRYITGKPIKFLGVGEKMDALEAFHPDRLASRLLGMGDMLSLIEEVSRKVDHKKAEKTAKKFQSGRFNLNDMKQQLEQMQQMGGIETLMDKLPGMSNIPDHLKNKNFR